MTPDVAPRRSRRQLAIAHIAPHLPWADSGYRCTAIPDPRRRSMAHGRRCELRPHGEEWSHAVLIDCNVVVQWPGRRRHRLVAWWRRWAR